MTDHSNYFIAILYKTKPTGKWKRKEKRKRKRKRREK